MPKSTGPKWNLGRPLALILAFTVVFALFFLRGHSQKIKNRDSGQREESEPVIRTKKHETQRPADDQAVITYIRQHLLRPPATAPYNLTHPEKSHFAQYSSQSQNVYRIFNAKTKGVFVEARAGDGEERSHTLYLEKFLSWSGILIEPNPSLFETLVSKHRRAYAIRTSLAASDGGVPFRLTTNSLSDEAVPDLPLSSVLQAVNMTRIDFLSLDVGGLELQVLQTIPWERVKIRLMCVKANKVPGGPTFLSQFMETQGYASLGLTENDVWFAFL
ncbi:protein Star [Penaeus vannamei]|uniref:protein Star n=1 Tax=Penaeus vannamei TaxID=6689 RepID=UPI00387F38B3